MNDHPVLIVDAMNMFVRSWAAFPTMSSQGHQVGGTIGFLKTLARLVHDYRPKGVYVAWEGGGSSRRRSIFSEYKFNRRPEKLNRFYEDDIPDTEENRKHQIIILLSLLKHVPACQLYVPDCEGDDIVAWLCRGPFKDDRKIIASSDKDMYQLLDNKTNAYSFHKKGFVTPEMVFEQFRVTTTNFAIAKALCGDQGDNVPGIKGIGFKKVAKLFPQLGSDKEVLLQDIISYCHAHRSKSVLYRRIIEQEDDLRRNWKLVVLNDNMISVNQASKLQHVIDTFEPHVDKMGFMRKLIEEGVNDFDIDRFFYSFNGIERTAS